MNQSAPLWVTLAVGIAGPILTLAGVWLKVWYDARSADQVRAHEAAARAGVRGEAILDSYEERIAHLESQLQGALAELRELAVELGTVRGQVEAERARAKQIASQAVGLWERLRKLHSVLQAHGHDGLEPLPPRPEIAP